MIYSNPPQWQQRYITYQLGIYADYTGYACAVVGIDDDYIMKYSALHYSDRPSAKSLIEVADKLKQKYPYYHTNINTLPYLEEMLKGYLFTRSKIFDINDSLLRITVLINDGRLEVEEDLRDTFASDAASFDPDVVSHRLNALALALIGVEDGNWLDGLLR